MARRSYPVIVNQRPKPLHPLDIAGAMTTLNEAATIYMALVDSVAELLLEDAARGAMKPEQLNLLGRKLREATDVFENTVHPE